MAKRWAEEEDKLILKMREEGFTTKEMAARLDGRTDRAITARFRTLGAELLNRRWTKEEVELAWQLKNEGRTIKHIAYRLGRTHKALSMFFTKPQSSWSYLDEKSA